MKWFKHMSDMSEDPRIKRLIRKHGGIAYAVYNYVLERIAKRLETESPEPDLEETAEDIADYLKYDTVKVEEIVWNCISEGLFEQDEVTGRVLCRKIYKFLEKSQTRSENIRQMVDAYATSQTVSDKSGPSEIRLIEQNRTEEELEEKRETPAPKPKHPKTGGPMNQSTYDALIHDFGKTVVDDYFQRVADYCATKGKRYKDHAAAVRNWLKRDGVQKRPGVDVATRGSPPPERCTECGGEIRTTSSTGAKVDTAQCRSCGAIWEYTGGQWRLDPETKKLSEHSA